MRRLLTIALFMAGFAASGQAAILLFVGNLAPEVAGSSGSGSALVTYDSSAHTLEVSFTFNNLTGTTTVAHIHCCVDPPGTVAVATYPGTFPGFPAGVTSGSYTSPSPIDLTLDASYTAGFRTNFGGGTAAGSEAALIAGLQAGRAYLNVHTNFAAGGEIRDFLTQVPEPSSAALFAGAIAAFAVLRFRK